MAREGADARVGLGTGGVGCRHGVVKLVQDTDRSVELDDVPRVTAQVERLLLQILRPPMTCGTAWIMVHLRLTRIP